MAKQIARLLKTTAMTDLDLSPLAQILKSKGRGNDKILAHITPKEAALLKKRGGSGTTNPDTGLPEFDDSGELVNAEPAKSEMNIASKEFQPSVSSESNVSAVSSQSEFPSASATNVGSYNAPEFNVAETKKDAEPAPLTKDVQIPSSVPRAGIGGVIDKTSAYTGLSPQTVEKLGLAGVGAIPGIIQSRNAQLQGQQAKQQQQAIATPYQQQGKELISQAQRGELTAANQQALQAAQAQLQQNISNRGGVGSQQAIAQMESLRQQLIQGQYNLGLQVSGIGDQIALGAIKSGLEADKYVSQLTYNYYTNVFRMLGGYAPQVPGTQAQQPAPGA